MPLKKRARVSNGLKQQRNTANKRIRRENESEEQRQSRLLQNRTTTAIARATESEEQSQSRLLQNSTATGAARATESEEKRQSPLLQNSTSTGAARATESEEQRQSRLLQNRTTIGAARATESEEQRQSRLLQNRTTIGAARATESEEQRQSRLLQNRTTIGAVRATESEEQRQSRLLQNRTTTGATRNKRWDNITRIAFSATECNNHPSLGAISMVKVCNYCNAKQFDGETSSICCSGGKIILESFPTLPPLIQELFSGESPVSKQFLARITEYNGCFAMTSFGHQDASVLGWNPSFRIKGQVNYSYSLLS